ncbi:MAG TPA: beta-glucosidase, partial [Flavobacteriaceae bacterium]|nr:beta-glucosidase [Flavobacteriaceae bacterium]
MKTLILLLFVAVTIPLSAQISNEKLDQIIDQLSLEEKVYLVIGTGMNIPGMSEKDGGSQAIVGSTKDKVPGAAGTSYTIKKFNFPAVVFSDGPAGIRIDPKRDDQPNKTFYATAFPTAVSLASSWNVDLLNKVGHAFGKESKAYGIDFLLGPALNIHRNPLGGRNFEYYSEDPVLAGKLTVGFVNGIQAEGVGATIKHFVANNSETNRTQLNTVVSERALREIYLKGFQIAVEESQPWSVMSSYNKINGTYASENEDLLTGILRGEWGFKGFVMTDWFGGKDAVAQMKAGNDLLMPGRKDQLDAILGAVKSGTLDESILDRNIKYILRQYYKTLSFKNETPSNAPDLEASKELAREAATESMVLLKNDGALPIQNDTKIALFGNTSYETIAGGTGSGDVNKAYMISVKDGFSNAGFALDNDLVSDYETYIKEEKAKIPPKKMFFEKDVLAPEKTWSVDDLKVLAERNDIAVFTLGRTSGEFQDRTVEGDFTLTQDELTTIKNISEVFHAQNKKFVILLNIGGVIETQSWKHYTDAILLAWQTGQETGNAIADLVSGKVNPSGKLPVTFPVHLSDVASTKNFPGKALDPNAKPGNSVFGTVPAEEIYEEGIYVGYRYFDTFNVNVSYPFGYGLSYTSFRYDNLKISEKGYEINIEFSIKNIGNMPGKEIAQLYVRSPKGEVEKPEKELKAFAKTKLLKKGESQKITLKVNVSDLGYYDTKTHAWKLDGGYYAFTVASGSKTERFSAELQLNGLV